MVEIDTALKKYHHLKIKDIMPTKDEMPIVCINNSVLDVLKLLRTRHHVWVIDTKNDNNLEGIIRYLDVIDFLLPPSKHKIYMGSSTSILKSIIGGANTVKEILQPNPLTINQNNTVLEVLTKMEQYKVQIIGVVDDNNKLVGEISLKILIRQFMDLCMFSTNCGE
ncbi:CBS domain-containing protein [Methanococcus voltae]|uniref:CBS domain-containing protein n=1 Tax=Methanococcus voltae TaxID=2188 RepID=UPI001AE8D6B9